MAGDHAGLTVSVTPAGEADRDDAPWKGPIRDFAAQPLSSRP
jgi:hypothetical protein